MLYDLNIAWSPSISAADLTRTLKFCANLGYKVVALNQTLSLPIPSQPVSHLPKFPTVDPASQDDALPTVLTRCTVPLADNSVGHHMLRLVNIFDIVAVRPIDEKSFQTACLNIEGANLISLDLTQFQTFHFKPLTVMAAVNRGMRFEICYSQVLSADPRARATFIGNLMQLTRATKGRGLVISSEARNVMELRGPADVTNLLAVWGLSTEKGKEALSVNPRGVVVNEGMRRKGFRGVVQIVQVAERDNVTGVKMDCIEKETTTTEKSQNKLGQKRKGGDNRGEGDTPMSKRQAKKLKKLVSPEGKLDEEKA